ncbi:MAG: DNA polymerase III subunit delta [Pseudomonadota bacterium]
MKANENQIRAALNAPSPDIRLYLLHGPDEAGARALAARLARAMGPEAERIDLDPATLRSDPARLADEAAALSLFEGARHVLIEGMGEESVEAVTALLAAPRAGNPVVAVAPGVKTSGKLVKLALADPAVLSFACYVPDAAEAERIADALARELGMRIAGNAGRRLAAAAGGDRAVMARELEKLALYLDVAPDRPGEIDDAALDAIGADLGEGEMNAAIDAAIDGRVADLAGELARLEDAGVSPIPLLRQLVRKLMSLAEMRAEIDAGAGAAAVIERHRIFFKDKAPVGRALRRWPSAKLSEAIGRARAGERAVLGASNAGPVLANAALTGIARLAARLR